MNNKTINTTYKIFDNKDRLQGAYSRSYHTEYEFDSIDEARNSNCHGEYKDKVKYKINKYKVTYELIDNNVDPPNDKEIEIHSEAVALDERLEREFKESGLTGPFAKFDFMVKRKFYELMMKDLNQKKMKG